MASKSPAALSATGEVSPAPEQGQGAEAASSTAPMPEPSFLPQPEPKPVASSDAEPLTEVSLDGGGHSRESGEAEFELWVEADLEAAWCLEGAAPAGDQSKSRSQQDDLDAESDPTQGGQNWKGECRTSCLRRRWDDFEALGHSNHTLKLEGPAGEGLAGSAFGGADSLRLEVALEVLGIPPGSEPTSHELASAFRQKSRTCHPDKVDKAGATDDFNRLVVAYQTATRHFGAR
eukprot:gb/GFBE01074168.1/.p1 GENE.gb/GFBE01074168.1/~~gb/GFBE01074168.1/.p1  ORF type:complete len:233 (+),score=44.15 gb/GFBE01074168.1/:1-699(+)